LRIVADKNDMAVLPCVDSMVHADRFTALRAAPGLAVLAVTLPSTLVYRVEADNPDAIVLGGEELLATARFAEVFAETPTVLMTASPAIAVVRDAARRNVFSVLPLQTSPRQLAAALAATVAGFAVTLPRRPPRQEESLRASEHLTAREVEVLRLMARGYRNKQVAAILKISEHTAKYHVSAVMAKLGARTRTEAVTIGVTRGLVAI
jgi:DNA-binding NarL/FixJ family response regulator